MFDQRFTTLLLAAALLIVVLPASSWAQTRYYYAQIGPTFGIVDDSFKGDYEDTVGVNARVGGRGEIIGLELHVEALPGSIVRRGEDSKEVGKKYYKRDPQRQALPRLRPTRTLLRGGGRSGDADPNFVRRSHV